MLAAAAFVTTNLAVLAMRGTMLGTKRATRALHMPLQLGSAGFIVKGLLDHPFNPHAAYLADGVPGCVYSLLGYYLFFFPVAASPTPPCSPPALISQPLLSCTLGGIRYHLCK